MPVVRSDSVDQKSLAYLRMYEKWRLPLTLMGGTRDMRQAGTRYLPQEPAEETLDYEARRQRTTLYNAFRRTVQTMRGKVFAKPIILKDDVPKEIKDICEDVDLTGRHLNVFSQDVFENGAVCGLSHILVDMPRSQPGATLADDRASKKRPYFIHVKAENVLGWRSEWVSGREQLTMLRIYELVVKDSGEFGEEVAERVRVYYPDYYEIYEQGQAGPGSPRAKRNVSKWQIVEEGPMTLGVIPLATFYANRTFFMEGDPPLEDLAWLNAAHWQSSSDQRHILHVARVPLLFGSGLTAPDGGDIAVGPNRMIRGPQGSDLKYVEHAGQAIKAGRDDLIDLEERMRVMGLELVAPKPGNPTATGKLIDHGELMSPLQLMAINYGDALEQAFQYAAMWMNKDPEEAGSVTVNTDFGLGSHMTEDLRTLNETRKNGDLTRVTLWKELKRRTVLADDFDPDKETAALETEKEEDSKFAAEFPPPGSDPVDPEDPEDPGASDPPTPEPEE